MQIENKAAASPSQDKLDCWLPEIMRFARAYLPHRVACHYICAAAHWARVRNGLSIKSDDVSAGQLNFRMTRIGVTSHHCTSAIRLASYKRINESHKFTWRSFKCHRSHIIYSIMQMKWNTPPQLTSNAAISSCDLQSLSLSHLRIHIRRFIFTFCFLCAFVWSMVGCSAH